MVAVADSAAAAAVIATTMITGVEADAAAAAGRRASWAGPSARGAPGLFGALI